MKEIRVGLIGFGTVGSGTAEVLYEQAERLKKRTGLSIVLRKVADISTTALPAYLGATELTRDAADIINDPQIDMRTKLNRAIAYYQKKYGQTPDLCYVHPSMLPENPIRTAGVDVQTDQMILPNHFWIGVKQMVSSV